MTPCQLLQVETIQDDWTLGFCNFAAMDCFNNVAWAILAAEISHFYNILLQVAVSELRAYYCVSLDIEHNPICHWVAS